MLRKLGIGAVGTVAANCTNGHFADELAAPNGTLPWGTLKGEPMGKLHTTVTRRKEKVYTKSEYKGGGDVMFFIWSDSTVVKFMSTIHTGTGFVLRARRHKKPSSSAPSTADKPFEVPATREQVKRWFELPNKVPFIQEGKKNTFFVSKCHLPVPEVVDFYNYNMNRVDLADQYRAGYVCQQISRKWWHSLAYFFVDAALVNSFLLWKWTQQGASHVPD
jgi:hypothetical protein